MAELIFIKILLYLVVYIRDKSEEFLKFKITNHVQ